MHPPLPRKNKFFLALVACGALLTAPNAYAQDDANNWANWRGPDFNGVANQAQPPLTWSESENVKWKVEVPGKGSATPIVWGNDIFICTAIPMAGGEATPPAEAANQGREREQGGGRGGRGGRGGGRGAAPTVKHDFAVVCLDRETGKQKWLTVVHSAVPHEGTHNTNTFASASPITDGKHIYASFGSNGIYCLDMSGKVVWSKMLGQMRTRNSFGEGASPALHGEHLIVPWDHEEQSFIVSLDPATGNEKWKVDRDEPTTWATPLITEFNGKTQVITNGTRRVRSYDIENGDVIWECQGQVSNPIPTPIRDGDYVIVMSGYQGFAIQSIALDSQGDVTGTDKIRWSRTDSAPYIATGVLYQDQLYFTKSRDAILSAVNATTGEVIIDQERLPQLDGLYASLSAAAGHIFAVGRNGTTLVLEHGPELKVAATNQLDEGIDASPVLLGKQIFLRGAKHLYCIEDAQ